VGTKLGQQQNACTRQSLSAAPHPPPGLQSTGDHRPWTGHRSPQHKHTQGRTRKTLPALGTSIRIPTPTPLPVSAPLFGLVLSFLISRFALSFHRSMHTTTLPTPAPPRPPPARAHTHVRGFLHASSRSASGDPSLGWLSYIHDAVSGSDMRMDSMRPPVLSPNVVPLRRRGRGRGGVGTGGRAPARGAGRSALGVKSGALHVALPPSPFPPTPYSCLHPVRGGSGARPVAPSRVMLPSHQTHARIAQAPLTGRTPG
jgi:hypothetical protein